MPFPCHHFGLADGGCRTWERPFHYEGGGLEDFFPSRLFLLVDVKAGFFFIHHLKPDFFSQRIEGQIFVLSHAW